MTLDELIAAWEEELTFQRSAYNACDAGAVNPSFIKQTITALKLAKHGYTTLTEVNLAVITPSKDK